MGPTRLVGSVGASDGVSGGECPVRRLRQRRRRRWGRFAHCRDGRAFGEAGIWDDAPELSAEEKAEKGAEVDAEPTCTVLLNGRRGVLAGETAPAGDRRPVPAVERFRARRRLPVRGLPVDPPERAACAGRRAGGDRRRRIGPDRGAGRGRCSTSTNPSWAWSRRANPNRPMPRTPRWTPRGLRPPRLQIRVRAMAGRRPRAARRVRVPVPGPVPVPGGSSGSAPSTGGGSTSGGSDGSGSSGVFGRVFRRRIRRRGYGHRGRGFRRRGVDASETVSAVGRNECGMR